MSGTSVLPTDDFSEAKARLSDLMTAVVHDHQPRLVQRHRGKETMLLVSSEDLARSLSSFRFDPRVTLDQGEVTVELERFGLLGFGETFESAMDDLAMELRAYARRFFERWAFYCETDRAEHWPWLLRFALTPADRQVALLVEDSRAIADDGRAA
jgi:Antitoxin of toxin-antitoxin, RelE / RelB, TA system